jgi:hypothetical protein
VVVIGCHISSSYPFYTPEASARASYYGITGVPTAKFDGIVTEVGGLSYGSMYPFYRHHVTNRAAISSSLVIDLTCSYDSVSNNGTVNATVTNTSGSSVSGNIHFAIIENNIPYTWGYNLTAVEHVLRDMLPDANGEAVTVPAADTIIRSRNFTIDSAWNELNCKMVVFVQASSREIYQGAEIAIIQEPQMEYYGLSLSEISGNGNGWAEPGETIEIKASGKNLGDGVYTGGASIQCSDPNITITGTTPATVSIEPGDVDTVVTCRFDIDAGCPDPYLVSFDLNFGASADTFPFMISSQVGFVDDIESGQGGWTHSGTYDNWHITTHKSHSPIHSWYCGAEGSWQYTNQNIAELVSPYFVSTPDSNLYFYHQYSLEAGWDYGYVEIDNGSGWWRTLIEVNGTQSSWIQDSYPLSDYNCQTVRIRFRFLSDYSVTQEGWYVDDIMVPTILGVGEKTAMDLNALSLRIFPNPCRQATEISFQVGRSAEDIELKIYDTAGRLVKNFTHLVHDAMKPSLITWDRSDNSGQKVASGIYFVSLETDDFRQAKKVVVIE